MNPLNNTQKKYLRSLAHDKKPVIIVGKNGLNPAVSEELMQTLTHHELLKIKINIVERVQKQDIINQILMNTQATYIQNIGSILVIYKAFDKNPNIILPK